MHRIFTFYHDPGHGWLEVSLVDMESVGLSPTDFSNYSYYSKRLDMFYLEEDCDASKFWEAYKLRFGEAPKYTEVYQDPTPIRNYSRIREIA